MWETTGDILIWVFAVLLVVVNLGTVAMVIFQLPGTWTMLALTVAFSATQMWIEGYDARMIGVEIMVVMLVLAVIGEVVETMASARGAAKSGGTRTAAVLSIVGGIVGAILGTMVFPVIGTILGACAGAGVFAIGGDMLRGREFHEARVTGQGAAIGKLWGTLTKVVIAGAMWLVVTVAVFWP
jgi:uncharacterized protein YqgC (DUF456 family)